MALQIPRRTLRCFDTIRRCGSVRQAARQLHIDSSALNRQLIALEDALGMPLFERLPRGLQLTPAGAAFAGHVLTVLQDEERLESLIEALRGGRAGTVHLRSVEGLSAGLVASVTAAMMRSHPGVRLRVQTGTSVANVEAVRNGDADLALSFAEVADADLERRYGARFRLGAVLHPQHPLAGRMQLRFAECAAHPLILSSPELSIAAEMQPLLARHPGALDVVLETGSVELARSIAAAGLGIAFQTRLGLEQDLADGRLVFVPLQDEPPAESPLSLFLRAGRSLQPALEAFATRLAEAIAQRAREELPRAQLACA
ncbi:LysR family transcriptional regulator [Niveibacterium sp. SC-1]|uniref:LysR family transcriptional regulator n=1 Tax=Niveibacterium sp. SC-1 TaxID=3135646 RepID=UPI00311D80E4